MTKPTEKALETASAFERQARALEALASRDETHREAAYARRLQACEYRRQALLLRGVAPDILASFKPSGRHD